MAAANIEEAIHTYALADANITGIIGNRFFFVEAEEGVTIPYVYYRVVSDPHEPFAFGKTTSGQALVQFMGITTDRYTALTLGNYLLDRFHLMSASTMDSMIVESMKCSGPIVMKDITRDVFTVMVDAVVIYQEP